MKLGKTKRPKRSAPPLPFAAHHFAGDDPAKCAACPLPQSNRVHDLSSPPPATAEQRAADLARLGERED